MVFSFILVRRALRKYMDGHEHCNYVQANATEPVGFMIGAHGMDDGECEERESRSTSRFRMVFEAFWWYFHVF